MSNKSPIQTEPCGVCTGWLRCKFKALVCWAQSKIEFLCERNNTLNAYEENVAAAAFRRFHSSPHDKQNPQVASYKNTKVGYDDWLAAAIGAGFEPTEEEERVAVRELTVWNKIGLLPMAGLTCMCCAGYRWYLGFFLGSALTYLTLKLSS